jgi:uncharacterized protein (DUF488 family)
VALKPPIFSVGHSTRSLDEFVDLLRGERIETVVDVRRFPRSQRNPQHSRERLERDLPTRGIDYVWLGEELGGFVDGGYETYMGSDAFANGIAALERLAAGRRVAFMCAEASFVKCHRRFVARTLASRGYPTGHLTAPGQVTWEETPLVPPDRSDTT